jgi:multidrug efflux system membrane fusion protein
MSMRAWILAVGLGGVAQGALALDLDGSLAWGQRVELGTLVSGVVSEVAVRPGDTVEQGASLLRLDDRGFHAEVKRARAMLARAESELDEARREDERAQELYDRTLLSDHERQVAQIALVDAQSSASEAQAALTQARLDLERSHIKAPFDARVLAVNAAVGQAVVTRLQSQPLIVLVDNRAMLAQAEIGASQLAELEVGQAAQVGLGGEWLEGRIYDIGLEPLRHGEREAIYRIRVMFEAEPEQVLRAGMPAVLRLGNP